MPLKKGSSKKTISSNISEFHKGNTFANTKKKFSKKRADAQAVAVAMKEAGKPMKSPSSPSEKSMESYAKKRKKK